MSGVPERYAADTLNKWNPKPVDDCFNILLLHQSIEPYVYSPLEPPSLNTSNLPCGFDLIVDGHIHVSGQDKTDSGIIIFPGSTIVTQLEKNEAGSDKGFFLLYVNNGCEFTFVPLQTNRRFFYEEVGTDREQIENRIRDILSKNLNKPPLIKMRIVGKEADFVERELREMIKKYSGESLLSFSKELESPEVEKKIEFLRNLREQRMSVEEIGIQLLRKSLEQMNFDSVFDYDQAFKLLSGGDVERAFDILIGDQATLTQVLKKSLGGFGKWAR
jgi:DNA repair exonuclease SbcCD nuclease subunit